MFILPSWPAPPGIKAYTSLRQGGQSRFPYQTFNLAFHVGDQEDHVKANRQKLQMLLDLPSSPIWLRQVHGSTVVEAHPTRIDQEADAAFTGEINQICVILTADCLPVLMCDRSGAVVAAVHAGWRGLANGILDNTLRALKTNSDNLLAWLGPAIGPQQFEVGEDVYAIFTAQNAANKKAFTLLTANTWLANIYELARIQLRALGVSAVYGGEYCTFSQKEDFFSYRRDQGKTGRMATLIWRSETPLY